MHHAVIALLLSLMAGDVIAQGAAAAPPQAYEDCRGRREGEVVQHLAGEGRVAATCESAPAGLVARPLAITALPVGQSAPAGAVRSAFVLTTDAGIDGGVLPVEYSCDGRGASPALSWSNPPLGTKEFAVMLTTIPVDGATRWNWVLFGIPGTATGLVRNSVGRGILGATSHDMSVRYEPPCPNGPGAKWYTFTVYALSASPSLPGKPAQVTGAVLTQAIRAVTLGSASFSMRYTRR